MSTARFNPDTLELSYATPYEQAHEWAHVEQAVLRTAAWLVREKMLGVPFLDRVANIAVECEAACLARSEMRAANAWLPEDRREALAGLRSYAESLFSPKLRIFLATIWFLVKRPTRTQLNTHIKP